MKTETRKCPVCDGKGHYYRQDDSAGYRVDCNECKGTGAITRSVQCGSLNPAGSLALPPLAGELKDILGRMIYNTAGIGRRLDQLKLYEVPRRAEEEQAAALHWMINLYLKHGDNWRVEGEKILKNEAPENAKLMRGGD